MVETALRLIADYQGKQVDLGGNAYILHPIRIALKLDNETQRAAALLHDIIEDTSCSYAVLESRCISKEVIDIVRILTRLEDESYMDYIRRIKDSNNNDAIKIKMLDLIDNMDLTRLKEITPKDMKRCEKYQKAFKVLAN